MNIEINVFIYFFMHCNKLNHYTVLGILSGSSPHDKFLNTLLLGRRKSNKSISYIGRRAVVRLDENIV